MRRLAAGLAVVAVVGAGGVSPALLAPAAYGVARPPDPGATHLADPSATHGIEPSATHRIDPGATHRIDPSATHRAEPGATHLADLGVTHLADPSARRAPVPGIPVPTVYMVAGRQGLRFVGPESIVAGETLRVVNRTDPRRVGPNTFSLVTRGSIPRGRRAQRRCAAGHLICGAIARWHGVEGNGGRLAENPARAGEEGWDTPGSVGRKGDSWFAGERPGGWVEQPVTADASLGPTRLFFLSATHPWMRGSIEVLPSTG